MNRHPGLGVEHSGSREFWSDANMNARAVPANAMDLAMSPNEIQSEAVASSLALQQIKASGGALPMLRLAEIEVDEGFRSSDLAKDYLSAEPAHAVPMQAYAPPVQDEAAMADRIAAMVMDRLNKSLGGN